jgi:non-heme chloroperoxidase
VVPLFLKPELIMNHRQIFQTAALGAVAAGVAPQSATSQGTANLPLPAKRKSFITAKDGANLHVQDWGTGRPVVLLAAWAFNSSIWGEHIADLTMRGFRCIALDRRGHGRSDAPSGGYDLDTLADDVAALFEQRDLRDAVLVAYSMGSIEAVRYLTRHGTRLVRKLVLVAPTTPLLRKTGDNPDAVPAPAIEAQDNAVAKDFAKWIAENEAPFVMPDTIPETRTWIKAMMLSLPLPVALACRRTISTADTRSELAKLDLPTLILQGNKDASAPLPLTGVKTAKLIKGSRLVVYDGAPHGLVLTHRERFLSDVIAFIAA